MEAKPIGSWDGDQPPPQVRAEPAPDSRRGGLNSSVTVPVRWREQSSRAAN